MNQGEIILYQPVGQPDFQIEVRIEDETVWLNRLQIAELFDRDVKTIGKHITNALREELQSISVVANFAITASDGKTYKVEHFNLDMILSIGYRVKSQRGVQFRIWANKVLKEYLLKGYVIHQRIENLEDDVFLLKKKVEEFDIHIKTSLPPHEGIFFDGQIFDAYAFVSKIVKSAKKSIILIDNYIDESVLTLLSKRSKNVTATIYTTNISKQLHLDLLRFNAQYPTLEIKIFSKSHDRFLIIDEKIIYHIGASLKDLGKKWFAFSKIELDAKEIMAKLNNK
ncbi:MAG: DNA-binding protein [Bacteroidetes bacterium RIFOXYB2_FULL_35_7]|nr:MAG: DNA-binding protein [Bacteroidetes bacterium GWF2_35_48]OFY93941.1 MAG: DNA-binding protein [Bacteroidetes bacterium RIFOXYC12_FULL_35_7]OFY97840.1 MAG: DNA-binding protein [Bacteroidetes bacterium RIFOXYB2_FULL_35_7]HBX53550.1 DNA-binding protein [Bacteroidales bacterium]